MIYAGTKANSISLYQWFIERGFQGNKQAFDNELFDKNIFSYQRLYVGESEGQITGFIQYGKNARNEGIIRFFHTTKEEEGKEMLFRALTYFYMFHIEKIIILDEKLGISNTMDAGMKPNKLLKSLFSDFCIHSFDEEEANSYKLFHAK